MFEDALAAERAHTSFSTVRRHNVTASHTVGKQKGANLGLGQEGKRASRRRPDHRAKSLRSIGHLGANVIQQTAHFDPQVRMHD